VPPAPHRPAQACHAQGFLTSFEQGEVSVSNFAQSPAADATSEGQSIQMKLSNAIFGLPRLSQSDAKPEHWDAQEPVELVGEYTRCDDFGQVIRLGATLPTAWQFHKLDVIHPTVNLQYRWGANNTLANNHLALLDGQASFGVEKADGVPAQVILDVALQMPLGAKMQTESGWANTLGGVLSSTMSLSDLVQFINFYHEDGAMELSALQPFYTALEAIPLGQVELCAAPFAAKRLFVAKDEDRGRACAEGMQASKTIPFLKSEFNFDYTLAQTSDAVSGRTHQYGLDLINPGEANANVLIALKRALSYGNDDFAIFGSLLDKFFMGPGVQSLFFEGLQKDETFSLKGAVNLRVAGQRWFDDKEGRVTSQDVLEREIEERKLLLPVKAGFSDLVEVLMGWGPMAVANGLGVFTPPPYQTAHVCFRDSHCLSNKCNLGKCAAATKPPVQQEASTTAGIVVMAQEGGGRFQRPRGTDGFLVGHYANATHRVSKRLRAKAEHEVFLAEHAANLDKEIEDLEAIRKRWSRSLEGVDFTDSRYYYKVVHPHEMMQLVAHEIVTLAHPEAREWDEDGISTANAKKAYILALASVQRLYGDMSVTQANEEAQQLALPHSIVTQGDWHTKHIGTVISHLVEDMRKRRKDLL
jgi:hypothetical protein